ncbi:ABC transporter ATP-binding protein [Pseudonocardia sp. GCM10023141]|uniref:ABC transporter ATP-binding protein n=1 Tax=Pseudonocardia sp. GCM10023141 TaxID=3252653 RepID=UPI00360C311D
MSTAMIECVGLTAGYAGVPVVRKLDIHVDAGELVAILGPNGAGKTTTLLTLAGVLAPIDGAALFCGEPVPAGRPHRVARRGLSLVPDDRSIFYGLTTRENLRLARGQRGQDPTELVLEYFPALGDRMSLRAGLLSGGEQQMLALGRAIATRPKVLMVDEMSLGLAPVVVKSLMPVLRRIATELGTAVLIVEQHIDIALRSVDRAYVLNHGDLVQEGPATELAERRELLEASYLGIEAGAVAAPPRPDRRV